MKNRTAIFLSSLIIFTVFFAGGNALRAEDQSLDMVMSVQVLDTQLNPASTDYRNIQLSVGENAIIRSTIKSIGTLNQDYALRIASTTGTWTPVVFVPSTDEYRLTAVWHEWNTMFTTDTVHSSAEMQSNDILTAGSALSSNTVFFNDSEIHATSDVKGFNVPPQEDRNLFIWVQGPTDSTSGGANSTAHIAITVTATP